jgi:AcrR family transcriptional regulator
LDTTAANKPTVALRPGIADRLWEASRIEFSQRGYHGARVQGIARRAGCNVALLYRHWASKEALYLDVLRTVWQSMFRDVIAQMEQGRGPEVVVGAYLDASMRDPIGAQILVREFLDGGPHLSRLVARDPALVEPVQRAARMLAGGQEGQALRPGLDATVAVLSIGGLSALVASAHESARPFFDVPISAETWRVHVHDLLLHGAATLTSASKPTT